MHHFASVGRGGQEAGPRFAGFEERHRVIGSLATQLDASNPQTTAR